MKKNYRGIINNKKETVDNWRGIWAQGDRAYRFNTLTNIPPSIPQHLVLRH